jgi:uroporphyrinogen decarboxylase
LIGFSGAPWTLANFMMEGGSAKAFVWAKHLFYTDRALFEKLSEKLTQAVIDYLQMQIEMGVDAIQIFDSSAGLLAGNAFAQASGQWTRQIIRAVEKRVPVISFARGAHGSLQELVESGADVLGFDWTVSLESLRPRIPETIGLQGNLDPALLETTPELVKAETARLLGEMRGRPGHIVNLGHGVPPAAKLACIDALVATVRQNHEHA